ncbi:MAG TPA: carboxypeptidase-like regulatory domain-containing protein [Kofleriaceae bacterium]|nr:carboxypeptidase-like regulatory domain-containing protein [Kofleriaceae bacterium]
MTRRWLIVGLSALVALALAIGFGVTRMRSTTRSTAPAARAVAPVAPASRAAVSRSELAGTAVRAADHLPVAGALVTITRVDTLDPDEPALVASTARDGAWRIELAPGTYWVAATAPGLWARHDPIVVPAGGRVDGIELALVAGARLRGTVTDVLGGPVGGARIAVRAVVTRKADTPELVTIANERGEYELAIGAGVFVATASHDDYTHASHRVAVDGDRTLDFTLTPGGVIRGVVVTSSGDPVPRAKLEARGGHTQARTGAVSAIADDDGRFELRGLGSGSIAVTALGHGVASREPVVVALGFGEQADDVRVVVDPARSISGRVVRGSEPVAGARVIALSVSTSRVIAALGPTATDGRFEIVGLRPGDYRLAALGDALALGPTVTLGDATVTDAIVELGRGVTIAGRVEPAGIATIALRPRDPKPGVIAALPALLAHAESDASGTFVLRDVVPGAYTLVATMADGRTGEVALDAARDQRDLVVALAARATLVGRVVDPRGAPVAGVRVVALSSELAPSPPNAITDATGAFRLVGLALGTIALAVKDDQGVLATDGKPLAIAGAGEHTVTLVAEARDAELHGTVVDAAHRPVADVWVTARQVGGRDVPIPGEPSATLATPPVLTDEHGAFTITGLRHARYEVAAETATGSARAIGLGTAGSAVTLVLANVTAIEGRVTSRGAPVEQFELACRGPAVRITHHVEARDGRFTVPQASAGMYTCTATTAAGTATRTFVVPSASPIELAL